MRSSICILLLLVVGCVNSETEVEETTTEVVASECAAETVESACVPSPTKCCPIAPRFSQPLIVTPPANPPASYKFSTPPNGRSRVYIRL